ncbi:MAG TPA: low specificity L-threonine aldolase [Candidatus Thermoplasmatota archaeon]|nr:low specificity L-threonine aldolase [Candidatus Thermoplasmatota archaeon]
MRTFASDNNAGAHPKVLDALARVNVGHVVGYGDDAHTKRVEGKIKELLGGRAEAFLVFNGTGANVLGLAAVTKPHEAVVCAEGAHVDADECGAPERFAGLKLLPVATPDGKLTPDLVRARLKGIGSEHHVQPRVVTITQSTEVGTVYAPEEVRALSRFCRERGLLLHVDGARLANAVAALGVDARAVTVDAGVDALSFGATKNGAMVAEAVVFFDPAHARDFKFLRKQGMQLASKMRFVAAQWEALLDDGLWLANARHANAMAALLSREAAKVPGVEIAFPTQANAVFARLPPAAIEPLQREVFFYAWEGSPGLVRWVCSWDTTEDDVRRLVDALRRHLAR